MTGRSLACLLIVLGIASLWSAHWFNQRLAGLHTTHSFVSGNVMNTEVRTTRVNREQIKRYYHPIVQMKLPDGNFKTVILSDGSEVQRYKNKEPVEIYFPKESPNEAQLVSWLETVLPYYLSLLLALICAVSAVILWMKPVALKPEENPA